MKKLMFAVVAVLALSAAGVRAEEATASTAISAESAAQTGGMVDLSAFLGKARVGMSFTSDGATWTSAYLPVLSWLPDATSELLNLDGGVIYRPDDNKAGAMLALGLRVDNLIGMAFGGEYGKTHVRKATLPTFEVPAGYALIARQGFAPEGVYHIGFAVGF